ncbi:MAG TPA: helix-turn-helix transcriptional regulator [Azospirillum sp.]|nr:helix-turn-helix transcriptional regulator [Azospirillum sp.]
MNAHEQYANTREAFRRALNRQVNERKVHTVKTLADAVGVSVSTIQAYLAGRSMPEWHTMVLLLRELPPQFAEEALAPAGLGGVRRVDEMENCGATQMARLAGRMHKLADALADNRIDHRESRELTPEMRALGVECIEFAASLEAGAVKEQR